MEKPVAYLAIHVGKQISAEQQIKQQCKKLTKKWRLSASLSLGGGNPNFDICTIRMKKAAQKCAALLEN